jgi:hypothetical protein
MRSEPWLFALVVYQPNMTLGAPDALLHVHLTPPDMARKVLSAGGRDRMAFFLPSSWASDHLQ